MVDSNLLQSHFADITIIGTPSNRKCCGRAKKITDQELHQLEAFITQSALTR